MSQANVQTHAHPNYVKVWAVLMVLAIVSFFFASIKSAAVASVLIFTVAFIKAGLVAYFFMHLKYAPKVVHVAFWAAVVVVLLVLFGLIPDIVYQFGRMPS